MRKFYTLRTFQRTDGRWQWQVFYRKKLMLEGVEVSRDRAAFAVGLNVIWLFGCQPHDWLKGCVAHEFDSPF